MPMMTRPRSYAGCWTCRLRHKKCDEALPVCGGCGMLEIRCRYDHNKPEWMDNGARQHEMAERVKAEVKRSAKRRRGRRLIRSITQEMGDEEPPSSAQLRTSSATGSSDLPGPGSKTLANNSGTDSILPVRISRFPSNSTVSDTVPESTANSSAQGAPDDSITQDVECSCSPRPNELELSFVMTYLDHVFPVLFPFYRPSLLEGGRSWLLVLVMKNKGLYHTVISLTSYFFSVVPINPGPAHQICTSKTWEELQKQTDLAVKMVQRDSQDICGRGVQAGLLESAYLMGNVVQLLSFEVIIAPTENWKMHLDAAIALFEQIFQYYGTNQTPPSISAILDQMGHRSFVVAPSDLSLWNADQAAFRFFSAVLLVDDIISSTSLEHPPRLHEYHPHLLTNDIKPDQKIPLRLEDFVGCQNWALLLVGEIASLDAWKKDMKKGGTLSMRLLVQRAGVIERNLHDGLARLDESDPRQRRGPKPTGALDALAEYKLSNLQPVTPDAFISLTRIWAHAARTYLLIVVSGWQPANPEVRDSVAKTIDLFRELPSPSWLRTLVWPFCVTGCLAQEGQESLFREMVSSMGALQMFGTMRAALSIMENVWSSRAQIDPGSWDLAACLKSEGRRVLLV